MTAAMTRRGREARDGGPGTHRGTLAERGAQRHVNPGAPGECGPARSGPGRPRRMIGHAARRRHREHEHHARHGRRWGRSSPPVARAHPAAATADELELLLAGLLGLDGRTLDDVTAIAIASVVPAADRDGRGGRGPPRASASLVAGAGTVPIGDPRGPPGRGGRRPARQRRSRHSGSTARRRSSWTSAPPPRSTASAPTAPTSAARSRPAWSWASRRSRPAPPSCRGSSCGRRTARSAATP